MTSHVNKLHQLHSKSKVGKPKNLKVFWEKENQSI